MIGTITKRARRDGKPAWGYSFFAGRTSAGKRIQITKSGFDTRKEAADALRKAIEHHRSDNNGGNHLKIRAFLDRWLDEYAKHRCTAKTLERYVTLGRHAIKYLVKLKVRDRTSDNVILSGSVSRPDFLARDERLSIGMRLLYMGVTHHSEASLLDPLEEAHPSQPVAYSCGVPLVRPQDCAPMAVYRNANPPGRCPR
jgi:hypothetical protein